MEIWKLFMDCFGVLWPNPNDLHQLALWWSRKHRALSVKDPWTIGLVAIADNIWRARNARYHNGIIHSTLQLFENIKREVHLVNFGLQGVINTTCNLLCCCHHLGINVTPKNPPLMLEVIWCKPPRGWYKLNVDGCSLGNPRKAGAGGVLRDQRGATVGSFKSFLDVELSYFAEFNALIEGILLAKEKKAPSLWIESDSIAIVLAVQVRSIPWYIYQDWISCLSFLNSINLKITHCFREANIVADFLVSR
ncbi:uncharacterized protein LOC122078067 [Macadamia integrifolia]|uniref:uncharacterized protein LOC122078067 n=1 Tax=Macadamia integrifolia TaxID=60698 RepID=UPI001C4F1163|nr:uncharacterized protein LOC122078067 [Macadamia integrifolia]